MRDLYAMLMLAGLGWLVWQSFRPRRDGARAATPDTGGTFFGSCDGGDGGHGACGDGGGGGDGGSCGGD